MDSFPRFCLSQNHWGPLCEMVLTCLKRNNLQFIEGTICNLQVLSTVLLAFSWAVDTDGDFCGWPQRNSSDWQEGWNVCLMTHPCTLFSCPCLLLLSDTRQHLLKTRPKKGLSKLTALHNNDFFSWGNSSQGVGYGQLYTSFTSSASVLGPSPKSPCCSDIAKSKIALT